MELKKYDIHSENFDYWFNQVYATATADMKASIPDLILRKINTHQKDPARFLTYLQKRYILGICFGYKIFDVFCNESGIDVKTFSELTKKSNSSKTGNGDLLKHMHDDGIFVVGNVAIAKSLTYAEHLQHSDIFNLVKDAKTTRSFSTRKFSESRKAADGLVRWSMVYEARIKGILKIRNLTPADWCCLIYHYDGEKHGTEYNKTAFPAYTPNSHHLRMALYKMVAVGYVIARGNNKKKVYRLTESGIDIVDKIMDDLLKKF